jgi:hypothetical protein
MQSIPDDKSHPESAEKEQREVDAHDLKAKTDPNDGTTEMNKDDKRTVEADFMKGLN